MCRETPHKATSAHSAWSMVGAFSLMEAAKSAKSPKARATATRERSLTHSSVPTARRRAPIAKDCESNRNSIERCLRPKQKIRSALRIRSVLLLQIRKYLGLQDRHLAFMLHDHLPCLISKRNELGRFLIAALKVTLGFFVWLFRSVFKWVM